LTASRGQVLSKDETDSIRTNVMWVAARVLGYNDPNLDVFEFAEACGVDTRTPSGYPRSGHITAGLRGGSYGRYCKPERGSTTTIPGSSPGQAAICVTFFGCSRRRRSVRTTFS